MAGIVANTEKDETVGRPGQRQRLGVPFLESYGAAGMGSYLSASVGFFGKGSNIMAHIWGATASQLIH